MQNYKFGLIYLSLSNNIMKLNMRMCLVCSSRLNTKQLNLKPTPPPLTNFKFLCSSLTVLSNSQIDPISFRILKGTPQIRIICNKHCYQWHLSFVKTINVSLDGYGKRKLPIKKKLAVIIKYGTMKSHFYY